jgi:hypothetical protein
MVDGRMGTLTTNQLELYQVMSAEDLMAASAVMADSYIF